MPRPHNAKHVRPVIYRLVKRNRTLNPYHTFHSPALIPSYVNPRYTRVYVRAELPFRDFCINSECTLLSRERSGPRRFFWCRFSAFDIQLLEIKPSGGWWYIFTTSPRSRSFMRATYMTHTIYRYYNNFSNVLHQNSNEMNKITCLPRTFSRLGNINFTILHLLSCVERVLLAAFIPSSSSY